LPSIREFVFKIAQPSREIIFKMLKSAKNNQQRTLVGAGEMRPVRSHVGRDVTKGVRETVVEVVL
jgi:hypothetical protein